MMQFSQQNNFDKQQIIKDIDELEKTGLSTLEAVSYWFEERSLPESQCFKIIPSPILEKIKNEVLADNLLRPSLTEENTKADLDFLYD